MKGILTVLVESLYITAKSHECDEVLDPEYTPSNSENEVFEAKHIFMFSVLDKHLLTDMGKMVVRKYVHTTDAQSVWKDVQEHMKSSSKGVSEKRRLNCKTCVWNQKLCFNNVSCGCLVAI